MSTYISLPHSHFYTISSGALLTLMIPTISFFFPLWYRRFGCPVVCDSYCSIDQTDSTTSMRDVNAWTIAFSAESKANRFLLAAFCRLARYKSPQDTVGHGGMQR